MAINNKHFFPFNFEKWIFLQIVPKTKVASAAARAACVYQQIYQNIARTNER